MEESTAHTTVTIVRGKQVLFETSQVHLLPRMGDTLRIGTWRCKVLRLEHTLSTKPQVHAIRIFVR
jgi:hypothetical protein